VKDALKRGLEKAVEPLESERHHAFASGTAILLTLAKYAVVRTLAAHRPFIVSSGRERARMPFDATHIVFAHQAAQAADPRLLRPELLAGAIAPDSVGSDRYLAAARTHLAIRRAARLYARADGAAQPAAGTGAGQDIALRAFAFGYMSHVWLDRFIVRWRPRQPLVVGGRRLDLRGLYLLLARRDAGEALRHWRGLGCGSVLLEPGACCFVDQGALDAYRAGVEARIQAAPPLEPDESAPAILVSERTRTEALRAFARHCRTTDPRVV
jgi:hypothetical protein